jgi:outer membrane protein OmpA-like peptidoglycan-associated protein
MWWFYTCSFCETTVQENTPKVEEKIITQEKQIEKEIEQTIQKTPNRFLNTKDEKGVTIYGFQSQLQIFKDSDSIFIPKSLLKFKDSLLNYLNNNQNKELQISGWYKNNEVQNNANLGIDRAMYLKKHLTQFGLNNDKISIAEKQQEYSYKNGIYNGGLELVLKNISKEKAAKINQGIIAKTLYTKFNSRKFIPDNTLVTYTFDLKNYLINHPNKTVKITGHTDSAGEESDNKIIGIDRAINVMNHFIASGIDKNKLKAFSEGENNPISDNTTKEGRAKNRRIEIIVN